MIWKLYCAALSVWWAHDFGFAVSLIPLAFMLILSIRRA